MLRSYIRDEGKAGRLGSRLLAIVAEGDAARIYLSPTLTGTVSLDKDEDAIVHDARTTYLSGTTPTRAMITGGVCSAYGLSTWGSLFTSRQIVALTTFSDLVEEARERVINDWNRARLSADGAGPVVDEGATAYGEAVALYLAFGVDKMSDRHSTLTRWDPTPTASGIINTFSRQALPMTWDYAEGNPFSEASGNFDSGIGWIAKVIETSLPANRSGTASI
ncbi:MAG: hypothetical protein ACM3NQ_04680, partial [Bacteroidales bacterium]